VNCSWSEERLPLFVDGDLGARERLALKDHVDACAGCASLLEELRVVDALLLGPRTVRLAPGFTFATMAEVRELPAPAPVRAPIAAFAVCYLVASWLLLAALSVLEPETLRGAAHATLAVVRTVLDALSGVGHVAARQLGFSSGGRLPLIIGLVVAVNVAFGLFAVAAVRRARPSIVEHLR
jgi:anti-sigma factor RsiW